MTPIDYNNPNDPWINNGLRPLQGNERRGTDEGRMLATGWHIRRNHCGIAVTLGSCYDEVAVAGITTTDTDYITKQQRDSFYLHDSIHIKERGDTVWIERWHTRCENHLTRHHIHLED